MYTFSQDKKQCSVKMTFSAKEFDDAVNLAYEKNKSKFRVQGFRNGKAPRKVIEKTYGDTVFFDDAFENLVQTEYDRFLDENPSVKPASYPEVKDNKFTADNGLEVTLTVDLLPEVELCSLSGLESKMRPVKVDKKRVDQEVEKLAESHARFVESDGQAQIGDFATIDFSGAVDGVKFDGGSAQDYRLELGSHTFIEGFEEQIVGMSKGESRDINVVFPKNYHAENLKGKPAVFTVKLNKLEKKELPEVNDKFISDVTEFETLEQYRKDLMQKLTEEEKNQAKLDWQSAILDEIAQKSKMEIPHSMIHNEAHEMIHDFEHRLAHQGMKLEDYLGYLGKTYDQFHDEREADAEKNIRTRLVLQKIIAQHNIKVTNAEVDEKIKEYADKYKMQADEIKKGLSQQDFVYFNNQVIMEKVFDIINNQNK